MMEAYIGAGQTDRDPYWCDVWPSAISMAEELLARPDLVQGKSVCEIGCGLGLAGLAAAMCGKYLARCKCARPEAILGLRRL